MFESWKTRYVLRRRRVLQFYTALLVSSSKLSANISSKLRREERLLPSKINNLLLGNSVFLLYCRELRL